MEDDYIPFDPRMTCHDNPRAGCIRQADIPGYNAVIDAWFFWFLARAL